MLRGGPSGADEAQGLLVVVPVQGLHGLHVGGVAAVILETAGVLAEGLHRHVVHRRRGRCVSRRGQAAETASLDVSGWVLATSV